MTSAAKKANKELGDELNALLAVLPPAVRAALESSDNLSRLIEVALDLGRRAEARFLDANIVLTEDEMTRADIDYVSERAGAFGDDNRAGIERTLHRISALRNRAGAIIGVTARVGRAITGSIKLIDDLVSQEKSLLLLGRPGIGKTTMLREVARALADEKRKRVIIVDTSNEIAGDGDIAHPAVGRARRMQVSQSNLQHRIMIEAVENHMPEVIVIDEISTELEAGAARTIAERGVQLIATAHGNYLNNVVANPLLADLVGGVNTVILGDEEAQRRKTQKTVLERKHAPTFDAVVEIHEHNSIIIHPDVSAAVDILLKRGVIFKTEARRLLDDGTVQVGANYTPIYLKNPSAHTGRFGGRGGRNARPEGFERSPAANGGGANGAGRSEARGARARAVAASSDLEEEREDAPVNPYGNLKPIKIHPFGVSQSKLIEVGQSAGVPVEIVDRAGAADVFLTTKAHQRRCHNSITEANRHGVEIQILRRASDERLTQFLYRFAYRQQSHKVQDWELALANAEVERAVAILNGGRDSVELAPQSPRIRRLQHKIAETHGYLSVSEGERGDRHVVLKGG